MAIKKETKMKTIKINGEFTKKELEEKLKEFDKPVWEIKKVKNYIELFKNGKSKRSLLYDVGEHSVINLSTISRDMACGMGDLMETKDVINICKTGYAVFYDSLEGEWDVWTQYKYTNLKHFKTEATAELATKLLNESEDMKDWIKEMSE